MDRTRKYENFTQVITNHAQTKPTAKAYTFLNDQGEIQEECTFDQLRQKAIGISSFLRHHIRPGDRALLVYTPGMPFIYAFIGCLYAGVVAVPVFPPLSADMLDRLRHIKNNAAPAIVLTDTSIATMIQQRPDKWTGFTSPLIADTQTIEAQWADHYRPLTITSDDLAFLQYTSGSTGYPKGVMVTHGNLLSNEAIIQRFTRQTAQSVMAGWLPHFHDMGLIGCILFPCYMGFASVLTAPQRFVRNPLSWLKMISDFRCTITTAPNFAYELCSRLAKHAKTVKSLDLSCLDTAINGAETVRSETLERFDRAFKPYGFKKKAFLPAFGLAEATLFVAGRSKQQSPRTVHVSKESTDIGQMVHLDPNGAALVSLGRSDASQRVIVAHPEQHMICGQRQVGEIWLKGSCVAAGYWQQTQATHETFQAWLPGGDGPYLRTGDLGFIDRGELYITGRLKDIIIIHGRNYYPEDIEDLVAECSTDIRPGRAVAFSLEEDGVESICVVAEFRGKETAAQEVLGAINQKASVVLGLKVDQLVFIKTRTLLLTTSGKVRRKDTKAAFLSGRLDITAVAQTRKTFPKKHHPSSNTGDGSMAAALVRLVAERLHMPEAEIDIHTPLGQYGLSSVDAVSMSAKIEAFIGKPFAPMLIYEHPTIDALARHIQSPSFSAVTGNKTATSSKDDTVAVIGMDCHFPAAPDVNAFWHLLKEGNHAVTTLPKDRPGLHIEELMAESPACRWGSFIDDVISFDADFFGIGAAEAKFMDPQHRKLLEIIWRTIENAGYAPSSLSGSNTGIFTGVSAQDYHQLICMQLEAADTYTATGLSPAMLSNRISYLLNLHGPSETIDTACSSSLVALHHAVQALRRNECDQAIVGGANLILSPLSFMALSRSGLLSPNGACRTFDADADGYVRGEGIGAVFLKPLSRAIMDNDHVYAVIKGSALNHGGKTSSLTAPSENAQAVLLRSAYHNAHISPRTITYIEAHGTGTALGDPIEVNALLKAFQPRTTEAAAKLKRPYCALGSVKTNIGHLEAAAGIAGLIKAVLALHNRSIPATLHYRTPNPYLQLKGSAFYIAMKTKRWARRKMPDGTFMPLRAGVSSFGFGGANAHVVLEEAPQRQRTNQDRPGPYLIVLSAKTPAALTSTLQAFHRFIEDHQQKLYGRPLLLSDIEYTLQMGREHFPYRIAFIACSKSELGRLLKKALANQETEQHGRLFTGACRQYRAAFSEMKSLAESWIKGIDIDWAYLNQNRNGAKVPLPGYPFEKKPYWFTELPQNTKQIDERQLSGSPRVAPLPETIQWLCAQAADHLGLPLSDIDPEMTFEELGLDSLALINIHDRMQRYFRLTLPISVIQDYPNILSMAKLIAEQETYQAPDLRSEVKELLSRIEEKLKREISSARRAITNGLGEAVLLTGVTGFLGIFLLRQLIANTDVHIYCMLRASDENQGRKRLHDTLQRFHITDCPLGDQIHVICGDLSRTHFGLDARRYEALAQKIDHVFHCGAVVDWMKPYMSLKPTNVLGTVETLRFCAHRKVKALNYISSLAVFPPIENKQRWFETDHADPSELHNGYAQSKWVAETLCAEARRMGLPVNIFRFDYVAASTDTGVMKPTDFIVRLIKGCIQLGCIPSDEVNFDILSIDYLSRVILLLSQNNASQTYHLINRKPFSTSDFIRVIRRFGYKLERIPFDEWKKMVKQAPVCELYPLYPFLDLYQAHHLIRYYSASIDNTNTLTALYQINARLILDVPAADEVIAKTISTFIDNGHLPAAKYKMSLDRHRGYWAQQLAHAPVRLALPCITLSNGSDRNHAKYDFDAGELVDPIRKCCHEEDATMPEILLAIYQILLFRYTRQNTIPLAVPLAAPSGPRGAQILKTPIIQTTFAPKVNFQSLLQNLKQIIAEAWIHLDLPSDEIAKMLYEDSDGTGTVQYDSMFLFYDIEAPGDHLNLFPLEEHAVTHPFRGLKLVFEKSAATLKGTITYHASTFSRDTIQRFSRHLVVLAKHILNNVTADLSTIPIMDSSELNQVVGQWNHLNKAFPSNQAIHQLIARHAQKRPNAVALRMGEKHMTYHALEDKAKRLARYLQDNDARPGELICVCAEKGFELMIGLLGILKAGCTFFALDPTFPEERKRYMLSDAQVKIVLTETKTQQHVPQNGATVICLDQPWDRLTAKNDQHSSSTGITRTDTDNDPKIAYIIYTSGSTGRPKGIKVCHSGLINTVYALNEHVAIDQNDRVLTCASLNFDASMLEMFWALICGAELVLVPTATARDGQALKAFLEKASITLMIASVPTWRMLEYAEWQGDPNIQFINGGEALSHDLAQKLIKWGKCAYNAYGPAEASVATTIKKLMADQPITIGRCLANTQVYILDDHLNPLPLGVPGELCIGGAGLAEGYHRRPDLTEAKFIPNPIKDAPSPRIYKTGDLARLLPDGEIEFIGRIDHQIKLRGHRIELGEIEHVLSQSSQVAACAVLARQPAGQEKKLIAYIIPAKGKTHVRISIIREELRKQLPSFMIPTDYVLMAQFPVTPGGKIDYAAFPVPDQATLSDAYVAPSTPLEVQLADIWKEILHLDRVGVHNNFLDLGGDSILLMQLLLRIKKVFNTEFTIQGLYENLTVFRLAKVIVSDPSTLKESSAQTFDYYSEANFDIPKVSLPGSLTPARPSGFHNLLISGGTGFLGAYVLKCLLDRTHADIYALVRAGSHADAAKRIERNLKQHRVWQPGYRSRIKAIVGDLGQPKLGIQENDYRHLSTNLDAIYHCGSMVNFAYPYSLLKKPNVEGTKEMIKLAIENRPKHLFYVSTIGVFEQSDLFSKRIIGEKDPLPDPEGLLFGYSRSKWVAERILLKAMEKGVPVSIFRPGQILGHSVTGISNKEDLVNILIKVFNAIKALPDVDFQMNGLPVDFVADAIVQLSTCPGIGGKAFHIVNPEVVSIRQLIGFLAAYINHLPILPYAQWHDLLLASSETHEDLLPYIPVIEKELTTMNGTTLPIFSYQNTQSVLPHYERTAPKLTEKLFRRYFRHLKSIGFIGQAK